MLGGFHPGRENKNQLSYSSCRWASCHSSWMKAGASHPQLHEEPRGGDKAQQHFPHTALCSLSSSSKQHSPSSNTWCRHDQRFQVSSSFPALLLAPKKLFLSSLMHKKEHNHDLGYVSITLLPFPNWCYLQGRVPFPFYCRRIRNIQCSGTLCLIPQKWIPLFVPSSQRCEHCSRDGMVGACPLLCLFSCLCQSKLLGRVQEGWGMEGAPHPAKPPFFLPA